MIKLNKSLMALIVAATVATGGVVAEATLVTPTFASTAVALIVNGNAITNYDIQRRIAFLRLQHRSGNLNQIAKDELTDEMLKRVEMKRRNISVSDADVKQAFAGFAQRNNMRIEQLSEILDQAGVTADHFKTYIMVQMGWGRLVSARYLTENGGSGLISEHEAVQRMIKNGGVKPVANEYQLQQVIFVVPNNRRAAILGKRRQEASALRARFKSCDTTRSLTKGMLDVTVRDIGRILEQQLPEDWEKQVKATSAGHMATPIETKRGIEVLAVCAIRKVSDDRVARLVFTLQDRKGSAEKAAENLDKKYLKELRASARIEHP